MSTDGRQAGLTPGQYRVMAVGCCFPLVCGLGFGVAIPLHAILSPGLAYFSYAVALPSLLLIALFQFQLWRATQAADDARRTALLARVRRLYAVPIGAALAGVAVSGAVLLLGPPRPLPPVIAPLIPMAFIISLIGLAFLPFAFRARSYLPQS